MSFPGKILLFGEYTVLVGGRALAIPVHEWMGKLTLGPGRKQRSELYPWVEHLKTHCGWGEEAILKVEADLLQGMYFDSSIPQGYGLGSSGALCAAMFARYIADKDMAHVRLHLAKMEAFFHGSSSGMDPLVSYLAQPILREGDSYTPAHLPERSTWPKLFLIDSGTPRQTAILVDRFRKMMNDQQVNERAIPALHGEVEHCITRFMDAHWELFFCHLQLVSEQQFTLFSGFIPGGIKAIWKQTLDSPDIFIKLCGAGGGGYFLGFARSEHHMQQIRQLAGGTQIRSIRNRSGPELY